LLNPPDQHGWRKDNVYEEEKVEKLPMIPKLPEPIRRLLHEFHPDPVPLDPLDPSVLNFCEWAARNIIRSFVRCSPDPGAGVWNHVVMQNDTPHHSKAKRRRPNPHLIQCAQRRDPETCNVPNFIPEAHDKSLSLFGAQAKLDFRGSLVGIVSFNIKGAGHRVLESFRLKEELPASGKFVELIAWAESRDIHFLNLQEIYIEADACYKMRGWTAILAGAGQLACGARSGCMQLISPALATAIMHYEIKTFRLQYTLLRCTGGSLAIINTHAPHEGRPDEIQDHWQTVHDVLDEIGPHPIKLLCGDMNARLHYRYEEETDVIGPFYTGRGQVFLELPQTPTENREALVELMHSHQLVASNTFFEKKRKHLVSYHEPGAE
jgi:hypothetical protein